MRHTLLKIWLIAFLLLPSAGFPALSSATVWEVRASGAGVSDNNGGAAVGGIAGEVDRSQQNGPQVAIDNSAITTTITANVITFTGSHYTVLAGDVGNIVHMLTGTNVTAGWYQISSVGTGLNGTWTVTGAVNLPTSGTTTNATGNMGGALLTLSKLAGAMIASNKAYVTGAFTSTTTNTFAQNVAQPASATPYTRLIGYGAARGDTGHATLTLSTNTGLTGIACTGLGFSVEQVDVDCGSLGTSTGISQIGFSRVINSKISNFTVFGLSNTAGENGLFFLCEVTGGTAAASWAVDVTSGTASVVQCNVHDNVSPGIFITSNCWAIGNLVTNNSGASSDGIKCSNAWGVINNTVHGNGRNGIQFTDVLGPIICKDNLLTSNAGWGINDTSNTEPATYWIDGNAFYNNTLGTINNFSKVTGIDSVTPYTFALNITLSVSPFIGPTTGSTANFGLNNAATGGRLCRGKGVLPTWPGNTGTTGFADLGAAQHKDVVRIEVIH